VRRKKKTTKKRQSVLESLIKAITAYYADDVLAPGVQLAHIAEKNEYYAAIHRYPKSSEWTPGTPAKRVVAFKFRADDLDAAIVGIAKLFEKAATGAVRAQKILSVSLTGWRELDEIEEFDQLDREEGFSPFDFEGD